MKTKGNKKTNPKGKVSLKTRTNRAKQTKTSKLGVSENPHVAKDRRGSSTRNPKRQEDKRREAAQEKTTGKVQGRLFELECLQGTLAYALRELKAIQGVNLISQTPTAIRFRSSQDLSPLKELKRAVAVYVVSEFEVPRPKALLSNQYLPTLTEALSFAQKQAKGSFSSLRIEAAGKDSAVFQRLGTELAKAIHLPFNNEEGDLMLRITPYEKGWQVLTRLSPRPLSVRPWRVCNRKGGLNASLAAIMNDLARVKQDESYLNIMCGSGTLAIEQALKKTKLNQLIAIDNDPEALSCAQANADAANCKKISFIQGDATQLEYEENSFNVITADLPWGDNIGSHKQNAKLYPDFLKEIARVSTRGARLVILTHEIRLFEEIIGLDGMWLVKESLQVAHSGHNPKLYVLQKR